MIEGSPQSHQANNEEGPQVLDLEPIIGEDGQELVSFSIDPNTRGKDVITTLDFMYASKEDRRLASTYLLRDLIENQRRFDNTEIILNEVGQPSDPVTVTQRMELGENATLEDMQSALRKLYDEDKVVEIEDGMLVGSIDNRWLDGHVINGPLENEISAATPEQIADEMEVLTRQFEEDEGSQ